MADKATHTSQPLHSYMYSDAQSHVELLKQKVYELLNERSLHNKTEMAIGLGFK